MAMIDDYSKSFWQQATGEYLTDKNHETKKQIIVEKHW